MSDLSDLNSWWLDHINLSSDRGYPSPEQAARAAWEHQQAKVKELEGDVTHLTSCQSELTRQREVLKRDNAIINAEWERSTGVWQEEVSKLKAQVKALEGLCAITGVIEREKKYIAAEAKVEELTKLVASLEEVRAQEYAFKQAEVDRLTGAIQKWLDGDYPNPRRNRPRDCKHGVGYWQSCDNCETEYWESVLKKDGE